MNEVRRLSRLGPAAAGGLAVVAALPAAGALPVVPLVGADASAGLAAAWPGLVLAAALAGRAGRAVAARAGAGLAAAGCCAAAAAAAGAAAGLACRAARARGRVAWAMAS